MGVIMQSISLKQIKKIFNNHEIKALEEKKLLVKNDKEVFITSNILFLLGKKYLKFNPSKSIKLFSLILEIDKDQKEIYLYLLIPYLQEKNYEQVLNCLLNLENKNTNFYLYLLSFLKDLPPDIEERVSNLTITNCLTKKEYKNNYRKMFINKKVDDALLLIKNHKGNNDLDDIICFSFFKKIRELANLNEEITDLINTKKYSEAIVILGKLRKKLPIRYTYIYVLLKKIISIDYVLDNNEEIISLINNNEFIKLDEIFSNDKLLKKLLNICISKEAEVLTSDKLNIKNISVKPNDFNKITPWKIEIDNIQDILNSISINGIEETIKTYNLIGENKYIVMALYAQECFKAHLFNLGNKYLKVVLNAPYKSSTLKNLISDIENNKRVYKNNHKESESIILKRTL